MSELVFIDTETTSLRPDRRIWDIGIITQKQGGVRTKYQGFIDRDDLDLGNANLFSLSIGKFFERHPDFNGSNETTASEHSLLLEIEETTRGAHLVGAVVSFDAETLATRMRAHGICPSWHYHLIDVEALAIGYLRASGHSFSLPWKSDDLSTALGISVDQEKKHTALGDAEWAMAIWDKVNS